MERDPLLSLLPPPFPAGGQRERLCSGSWSDRGPGDAPLLSEQLQVVVFRNKPDSQSRSSKSTCACGRVGDGGEFLKCALWNKLPRQLGRETLALSLPV